MQKTTFVALVAAFSAFPAHAQTNNSFTLVSSTPKTFLASEWAKQEPNVTFGTVSKDKKILTFSGKEVRLIASTGPVDDMLSFRIQGLRNPALAIPKNATLSVLFVNSDEDMPHDIHFGPLETPILTAPKVEGTVGSSKLSPRADEKFSGEELVIHAEKTGQFRYFCSVHGHAKGGMLGVLAVGEAPVVPKEHGDHQMHNMAMGGMAMPGMAHTMAMASTLDGNDPMSRESSGTAWLPDSSPMSMQMKRRGKTMTMLHGTAFPRYTRIGGDRDVSGAGKGGKSRFDAPSMVMGMASHPVGEKGQIGGRLMLSADPFIERGYGYPLLFQSGETYGGQSLHDRQHPHDLVSELSASYSRKMGTNRSAYLYLGYPGEPALGPPTFMHRVSAMDNPDAPISHHWQDSTHITFGVATLGYSLGRFKVEGSAFKGEEPDENRYNFDSPRLDSLSGRVSWNPNQNWALQLSQGSLRRPEPAEPNVTNRHRTTASAIYNRALGDDSNWSNSLVWGQNRDTGEGKTNSYLFETNYQKRANTFYARLERVQKSGHELVLPAPDDANTFGVGSFAFGAVRDLKRGNGLDVGLGAQVTLNTNPAGLDTYYGGGNHTGFQVFLRIRPSRMKMEG